MTDKEFQQENEEQASMAVFGSVEQANDAAMMNSISAAKKGGLTEQVPDGSHILCKRPDSYELVDVFPDGSWEYQDIKDDGSMREMSGVNAALLSMYLASDENKDIFELTSGENQ